ncbi:MAG: pilus assembly PilX N-terminal domain-containing protein, partial [bacterium]|nr:pilus assembly PilX N-terminal domain-containing protein [bacterium]
MHRYSGRSETGPRRPLGDQGGYVLLAVTVFVFVLIIAGLAMFSTASYETRLAIHDQETTQAFYLADAALERARAKLLEDRTWRDGWTGVALAGGTYDLAIADTTIGASSDPYVRLTATGTFKNARRRIMAVGELPPAALEVALLSAGDLIANANVCIDGRVHVGGDADFGSHDQHLNCGTLTEGFEVRPPHMYTDPEYLTGSTYYEVRGTRVGGHYQAQILDRNGADITATVGDNLRDVTTYNAATGRYFFDFGSATTMEEYFDQADGVFSRAAGDASVIVNFGEGPVSTPPGPNGIVDVRLRGNGSTDLNTT